jgi:inhibitor of KinA
VTARPVIRPMGEGALLVAFGHEIRDDLHARVVALDAALARDPPRGVTETAPTYAALLVAYDPLVTDYDTVAREVGNRARLPGAPAGPAREHRIPISYAPGDARDLAAMAETLRLAPAEVIGLHLAGVYTVYMYGFAPGYAYLGGVHPDLRLPRKPHAVRGYPVGSVLVAGAQCLITTLPMPTGWWVIGRSSSRILDPDGPEPFLFRPGDRVRFEREAG